MIHFVTGNILDSHAQALVNTVNTMGVMGKGIALQFKKQFPGNYKIYKELCDNKSFTIGQLLITEEDALLGGRKIIINFPTKTHWRLPSEYEYIEKGLLELKREIRGRNIESIAIPPLGAGNGGLDWQRVRKMIIDALDGFNCDIYLYEPTAAIKELLSAEKVRLTPARAMLLSVLYEMVRHGEFVSEFAAEKAAYFLQRLGAKDQFRLEFKEKFYGPYSGKVRHVLYFLNGSYIMGYSDKDKKPFEELSLVMEAEKEIQDYLNQNENLHYKEIAEKTKKFLRGYYSPFGLELLSSIDFIKIQKSKVSVDDIIMELGNWSDRKRTLFANKNFVEKALNTINQQFT